MKRIKLWHWGAVLILSAMVALVYLGWKGMDGQRALIWQDATQDCSQWSHQVAQALHTRNKLHERRVLRYSYPPTPGTIDFNPDADNTTLEKWLLEGGTSRAGLPIRVLAGLALLKEKPNESDAIRLAEIARQLEPSAITPKVFDVLEVHRNKYYWNYDVKAWRKTWAQDEEARSLHSERPNRHWLDHHGKLWWFNSYENDIITYIHHVNLAKILLHTKDNTLNMPDWAGVKIQNLTASIGDSGKEISKVTMHTYPNHLDISVGVIDDDLLYANWKIIRKQNVTMMILASFGLISGIIVIALGDAKEKKRSREQNNFIASVTHELRAPVGSMRLMAEALEAGKVGDSKVPEFHRLMAREGSRLSCLIENVLDLSRIEAGRAEHHPRTVNLAQLASTVAGTLHMQAQEKKVSVKLNGGDLDVSIDPLFFQQALINLIDNAIKFSPKDGEVIVQWQRNSADWQVSVTDSGPGIPHGKEKQIFDRFCRTGNEMRRETQGAGIGLNLVNHVVIAHGGAIQVKNLPGAQFTLTFPMSHPNQKKIL